MRNMAKKMLLYAAVVIPMSVAAAEAYRPMVVEGNCWKYNMGWSSYIYHKQKPWELRIEGDSVVNGIGYKCLYAYTDYSDRPDSGVPYAFLREDCESQRVYCMGNPDYDRGDIDDNWLVWYYGNDENLYKEVLLYDFNDPVQSKWFDDESHQYTYREGTVNIAGETRRCWVCVDGDMDTDRFIVEGIGGVSTGEGSRSDVLGVNASTPDGGDAGPYFHTFVSFDGKETCLVPEHVPGYSAGVHNPMLAEGKTWKYSLKKSRGAVDTGLSKRLTVGGDTVVAGTVYKKLYSYSGDSDSPDCGVPYAFLREDADAWRVYGIVNPEYSLPGTGTYGGAADMPGKEVVLYDFVYPQFSVLVKPWCEAGDDVLRLFLTEDGFGCRARTMIVGPGDCWRSPDWENLYENVFDLHAEGYGQIRSGGVAGCGDLLNCYDLKSAADEDVIPFLYAVTDANGNEVFTIAENRPAGGVNAVTADKTAAATEYYDMQGIKVSNPVPGRLYIMRKGDTAVKSVFKP